MPCIPVKVAGATGVVCTRRRSRRCRWCSVTATRLCDGTRVAGRACDAPMCARHALSIGADLDLCPVCALEQAKRAWAAHYECCHDCVRADTGWQFCADGRALAEQGRTRRREAALL